MLKQKLNVLLTMTWPCKADLSDPPPQKKPHRKFNRRHSIDTNVICPKTRNIQMPHFRRIDLTLNTLTILQAAKRVLTSN